MYSPNLHIRYFGDKFLPRSELNLKICKSVCPNFEEKKRDTFYIYIKILYVWGFHSLNTTDPQI